MRPPRPRRLPDFDYTGIHRYSVTMCTYERRVAFAADAVVSRIRSQLLTIARAEQFSIPAYCFMPDHLHVFLAGGAEDANLPRLVFRFRQASGFWYSRTFGCRLWQEGYFDRVLRDSETTLGICRYILGNPVRAGLAKRIGDYPFAGSDVYRVEEIAGDLLTRD